MYCTTIPAAAVVMDLIRRESNLASHDDACAAKVAFNLFLLRLTVKFPISR